MASPGIPTEVFMAVPSMEVLFFADPALLGRLTGGLAGDQSARGRYQPKQVLQEFLRMGLAPVLDPSDLVRGLTDADATRMSEYPPVSDIKHFLQSTALTQAANGRR